MITERAYNSHAAAWTLSVVAVPVVYLLSVAPLDILTRDSPVDPPPDWLQVYAVPAIWVCNNTPLKGPLEKYYEWCMARAGWRL
jgi:hypothetical protein